MSERGPRLHVVPIKLKEADKLVELWHRRLPAAQGGVVATAVALDDGTVVGVATIGRPLARALNDGLTCEVTRVATDGTRNACSALYGAARRIAAALGYRRIVTYTLKEEPGTSLTAAGWARVASVPAGKWDRPKRPRVDYRPTQEKWRWEEFV